MVSYTERSFAYLDILGFSALVDQSSHNQEARRRLGEFIDVVDRRFSQWMDVGKLGDFSFFSDTILVSMPNPMHQFIHLIREIGMLSRYLLAHGFASRGGITVGPVFHQGRAVVGPALITAYELEKRAVYPRVLLDDAAIEYWRLEFNDESPDPNHKQWVKRGRDGEHFIDLFANWSGALSMGEYFGEVPIPQAPIDFVRLVAPHIEKGMNSSSPRVRAKWHWLHSQAKDG